MRKLLNMLKKNDEAYSIGRVCAIVGFVAFLAVSVYLAVTAKNWQGYQTFAYCCTACLLAQLCNKGVDLWGAKIEKDGSKNDKV